MDFAQLNGEKGQITGNSDSKSDTSEQISSVDFLCGWLNIWAVDGVRPVKDIFNEAAPSPYHPEWEPIFVVFSTKTGQLSHFLTEQYAEEFYRFTDNISLLGSHKEVSSDITDLKPTVTRRLDGGRASFMARWGYESLENLHTRFASRDTSRPSGDFADEHECDCNPHDSTFECSSNAILDDDDDDDDEEEHYVLTQPSLFGRKKPEEDNSTSFYIGTPLTSTTERRKPGRSVLRRDVSCSMDVLYQNDSSMENGAKTLTFGKAVFTPNSKNAVESPNYQPHVRRPSFRNIKAFLNQHTFSALRSSANENSASTNSNSWLSAFSGLKLRSKSQARIKQHQNNSSAIHCISSSFALQNTPDRGNNSFDVNRPDSSLFGSQVTMTTIDMTDPDLVHVRPVHPTLLNGHCFQISSQNNPQTTFYSCKSPAEGRAWLWELSNYSLASMPFNSHSPVSPLKPVPPSATVLEQLSTRLDSGSKPQNSSRRTSVGLGRTRVVNTLKLSVLEAVNLPQKYKYYCDIYIDEMLYARTTSKHRHELLFWGENFEFAQLPAVQFVQLKLYRESASSKKRNSKEKNSLLGSVSVPIGDISGRQMIDRWYPISVESNIRRRIFGQRNSSVVNVRIRGRYQSTMVLPQPNYRELINFISWNYSWVVDCLEPAIPLRLKDELASSFVHILQSRGVVVDFLVSIAFAEVTRSSSENEALAFRGNSIASKAFECYMKLVGDRYLYDLLSGFVQSVICSGEDCEVDPSKLQQQVDGNVDDILERNRFNLVSYCEMVWRKVLQSARWFPPELRAVFTELRTRMATEKPQFCDNMISACVFLRFLCPAILSPSLFGLCQEYPEERSSRTFTLVAKTIQTLANFARFGVKEQYMTFMNSFVEREMANVRLFLHNISSSVQEQSQDSFNLGGGPLIDCAYHSSLLHDVLCECIAFLPKLTAGRGVDSPRSDENDITKHMELQAVLDRLTEDLGSSSFYQGQAPHNSSYSTQTLPSHGRPQVPSLVAYDNVNFNTFPHKPAEESKPRSKSTNQASVAVLNGPPGASLIQSKPGSSSTLSPSVYRKQRGSKWQTLPAPKSTPENELEKSWNQLIEAAEMLGVDDSSLQHKQQKSGQLNHHNHQHHHQHHHHHHQQQHQHHHHSPTTRFSTLTSGYQSSSLSSSNSTSPTQTAEFSKRSVNKKDINKRREANSGCIDYSVISAHNGSASLPNRGRSHRARHSEPVVALEDSQCEDVFHHQQSASPLISSMEMSRLIGGLCNGDDTNDLLMVPPDTITNADSHHSEEGIEMDSVLDNLVNLERELKQEHAAIVQSSNDRQWLLENGQRCVGSLLEALTKLRKHCELISTIEHQQPTGSTGISPLRRESHL